MRYNEFLVAGTEKNWMISGRKENESGLAEYVRRELGNDISLLRAGAHPAKKGRTVHLARFVAGKLSSLFHLRGRTSSSQSKERGLGGSRGACPMDEVG